MSRSTVMLRYTVAVRADISDDANADTDWEDEVTGIVQEALYGATNTIAAQREVLA